MTKDIEQTITFDASPQEIYDLLMDSKKHAAFTGAKAKISTKVGGSISAYDDYAEGTNLELEEGKKIVQKWRAADWPEGAYSIATFDLKAQDNKTVLTFTQTDVPEDNVKDISEGWYDYYWNPMKEMLHKNH